MVASCAEVIRGSADDEGRSGVYTGAHFLRFHWTVKYLQGLFVTILGVHCNLQCK